MLCVITGVPATGKSTKLSWYKNTHSNVVYKIVYPQFKEFKKELVGNSSVDIKVVAELLAEAIKDPIVIFD